MVIILWKGCRYMSKSRLISDFQTIQRIGSISLLCSIFCSIHDNKMEWECERMKKKCDKFSNPKIKYLVVKHSKDLMFLPIFKIKNIFA